MKSNNTKFKLISLSIFSFLMMIISMPSTKAVDIPIEAWVAGELSVTLKGGWSTGLFFNSISRSITTEGVDTTWDGIDLTDYLTVVDDTETAGFYLTIEATDFAYTGEDQSQQALPASNMKFIGNYDGSSPQEISGGYNDESKELSIMPDSCGTATLDKFTWNPAFTDSQQNYTLTASNSPLTLIESTADCTTIANLRLDRITLFVDGTAAVGNYSSNMLVTIFDGAPI